MQKATPLSLKRLIFSELGITDTAPWEEKSVQKILESLRDSAAWPSDEMGKRTSVHVTGGRIRYWERSEKPEVIDRLLKALKPRLQALAKDGWLLPESFAVNKGRYDEIAVASHCLRQANGITKKEIPTKTDIADFEAHPEFHETGKPRSLANLMKITDELCTYYRCSGVTELLEKGAAAAKLLALDKDYLRAGLMRRLQEKKMPQRHLARRTGLEASVVNDFLNNSRAYADLPVHRIAQLLPALGIRDLPTLEDMGRAVYAQATHPVTGPGADAKGKPLPEPAEVPRAGGYFTLRALERLVERGAFKER